MFLGPFQSYAGSAWCSGSGSRAMEIRYVAHAKPHKSGSFTLVKARTPRSLITRRVYTRFMSQAEVGFYAWAMS